MSGQHGTFTLSPNQSTMAKLIYNPSNTKPVFKVDDKVYFNRYINDRGMTTGVSAVYARVEKVNKVTVRVRTADGSKYMVNISELHSYIDPFANF